MEIKTIDIIPRSSPLAAAIDDIAVFRDVSKISHISLPAKIDFFMLIMCEHGSIVIDYDTTTIHLTEADLVALRPGHILHSYKVSPDWRGHVIIGSVNNFDNTFSPIMSYILPCVIKYASNPVIKLTPEEMSSQIDLRTIIEHRVYGHPTHSYSTNVSRSLLEALFFETLGVYASHSAERQINSAIGRRKDTLLLDFVDLVASKFRIERSVTYYAEKLCVTPKHLSATVKEVSGRTASQWIDSYVIAEAKLKLRHSGMTIQEIATELNFPNQSFFGKYFKNLTGMSPREYRSVIS
ncbi:MAG: helix-turn-helix domain-containing protein [Muribaculum sp.]|nr:helix-turn-helix domain-containing protein [Muribaculum sp.]